MVQQVLHALEQAQQPLSLNDLAAQVGVDTGTLEGMLAFWERKGRIVLHDGSACMARGCGGCGSAGGCAFAGTSPRAFLLVPDERKA